MSYILEALDKSDQERKTQQMPDLNTVHRQPPQKTSSRPYWLLTLIVLVGINVAALWFWLGRSPTAQPARETAPDTSQTSPAQTTRPYGIEPATTRAAPVASTSIEAPSSQLPRSLPGNQSEEPFLITPDMASEQYQVTPVRITELPLNVQQQIPDLVFSSHLFSDDPGFRMVNINGTMIRQGDRVADELELHEITEGGVVLKFRHYLFEVSVLRDWSSD